MKVTKETWHMCKQCVPGSLSSSPAQEPGNKARPLLVCILLPVECVTIKVICTGVGFGSGTETNNNTEESSVAPTSQPKTNHNGS